MEGLIVGLFIVALVLGALALGVLATVFWVKTLIASAKQDEWGWFIGILFFGVLASLIYNSTLAEEAKVRMGSRERVRRTPPAAEAEAELSALDQYPYVKADHLAGRPVEGGLIEGRPQTQGVAH